jgi:hypothetical protein
LEDSLDLIIEQWPIERFIEYARNPRRNDEVVDKMVAAIKEFGFRIPIIAKSDGLIVDGHLRLKAARKLGLKMLPVALADELTDDQIKAFRLLANKSVSWAEWDEDLLRLEISELDAAGFDLDLTGFSDTELSGLMNPEALSSGAGDGAGALSERFMVPPFTVLNAREGTWQDRKRSWLALGIQSELGRGATEADASYKNQDALNALQAGKPHRKANAAPGGSLRPAANYKKGQRGDGRGRAID